MSDRWGSLIFEVTYDDMALLDSESFDLVWSALGLIFRERALSLRPPTIGDVAEGTEPTHSGFMAGAQEAHGLEESRGQASESPATGGQLGNVSRSADVEPDGPDPGLVAPRPKTGGRKVFDRDATIAAIRATSTFRDAAARLGVSDTVVHMRLKAMAEAGELPADIAARRGRGQNPGSKAALKGDDVREKERATVREVAADIKARESTLISKNVAEMDEFMARRKANAAAQANAAWEARRNGA